MMIAIVLLAVAVVVLAVWSGFLFVSLLALNDHFNTLSRTVDKDYNELDNKIDELENTSSTLSEKIDSLETDVEDIQRELDDKE